MQQFYSVLSTLNRDGEGQDVSKTKCFNNYDQNCSNRFALTSYPRLTGSCARRLLLLLYSRTPIKRPPIKRPPIKRPTPIKRPAIKVPISQKFSLLFSIHFVLYQFGEFELLYKTIFHCRDHFLNYSVCYVAQTTVLVRPYVQQSTKRGGEVRLCIGYVAVKLALLLKASSSETTNCFIASEALHSLCLRITSFIN